MSQTVGLKLVPTLTRTYLAPCAVCGDRHPLAYMPPENEAECPTCGASTTVPFEQSSSASFAGADAIVARGFAWVGRMLNNLANRI